MKKKILSAMLAAVLTVGSAALPAAAAEVGISAEPYFAAKLPTLINNVGLNDYQQWSSPITSYLTKLTDGYMRVQADDTRTSIFEEYGNENSYILIEYYDNNFKFTHSKKIKYELPIFGGFYETDDNFYILCGQVNQNDDDTAEVFRFIKYDKSWNRISSASIFGSDTSYPFRAGNARFVQSGNTIVIRTSRLRYISDDGFKHQSNITLMFNTDDMTFKVDTTDQSNDFFRFNGVSHSFNQFIKYDNGMFIEVDHGDGYPRAIVLRKTPENPPIYEEKMQEWYNYYDDLKENNDPRLEWSFDEEYNIYHVSNFSELFSDFWSDYYALGAVVYMLPFSGACGDNYTGATVGGFEFSDSSYIVAGTTVDQAKFSSAETRNVFVSVIDKDCTNDSKPTVRKITNYAEGQLSPSNPQLVKINDNKFVLMWTYKSSYADKNKVYLTELNGKGETVGKKYSFTGELSDCQPIVSDGKIMWYVCDRNKLSFYSVSTSDLSKNSVTEICTEKPAKVSDYGIEKLRSTSTVKFNWKPADRASSYVIKYSTDGRSWKTVTADTNTCSIKKLKAGTKYYIKIAAKNSVGTSDYCKTFTITTKKKK